MCLPEAGSPNLTRCRIGCGNIAVTDRDADKVVSEVANIDQTLDGIALPEPLRQRLADRRRALEQKLSEHARTRSTP